MISPRGGGDNEGLGGRGRLPGSQARLVAVIVTLPTFKALALYPVEASPEKETTVESLLSKVKVVNPESAVIVKSADCPTCLSDTGWKVRI